MCTDISLTDYKQEFNKSLKLIANDIQYNNWLDIWRIVYNCGPPPDIDRRIQYMHKGSGFKYTMISNPKKWISSRMYLLHGREYIPIVGQVIVR